MVETDASLAHQARAIPLYGKGDGFETCSWLMKITEVKRVTRKLARAILTAVMMVMAATGIILLVSLLHSTEHTAKPVQIAHFGKK